MPTSAARNGSSPDPAKRWRPQSRAGGVCGYTFDDRACRQSGAHYCEPRADRFVAFCSELLVHTTGPYARHPFVLEDWQEMEIARPIFGEVVWSPEWGCYVRRYRVAYIVIARKNGKSALAAAVVLYLLVGDDEEAAEVYGAARDTKQAGKVYQPVQRMVMLSPTLRKRLKENKAARRIYDESSGSFYEIITADALGELGHNPHGFVLDEVLSQRDDSLWETMRTAVGARVQSLLFAVTTETADASSFGATMIDEAVLIEADPSRSPHIFAWVRKTPMDAEPWDEAIWYHANPALGTFKSLEEMRAQALEAKNEPAKENGFRQFQLNQRVQQTTRWMPLQLWDATAGIVVEGDLQGRPCYGGLDLAAISDLTSLCWFFPGDAGHQVVWRHFVPEEIVATLDKHTGGQFSVWVRDGFVEVTEGDVVDYDALHARILADAKQFAVESIGIDRWNSTGTTNWLQKELPKVQVQLVGQGFAGMTLPMKEIMRQVRSAGLHHGGNPVARWCFDSVEVRQDESENIKPVKPDRQRSGKRIDAVASLADAIDGWLRQPPKKQYRASGF